MRAAAGCSALPFVENDNAAIRGAVPNRAVQVAALARPMSTSWSSSGSIITALSAKRRGRRPSGGNMRKLPLTLRIPGASPTHHRPARITCAVGCRAPATIESAIPSATSPAPNGRGDLATSCAVASFRPRLLRRSNSSSATAAVRESSVAITSNNPGSAPWPEISSLTLPGSPMRRGRASPSSRTARAAATTRGSSPSQSTRHVLTHTSRLQPIRLPEAFRGPRVEASQTGASDPSRHRARGTRGQRPRAGRDRPG